MGGGYLLSVIGLYLRLDDEELRCVRNVENDGQRLDANRALISCLWRVLNCKREIPALVLLR
ncbi:hypothetical protein GA0061078_0723 [Bifidobacterium bohemicum]|nr:hypothetical protein GA0061078_0723 [Bifidobacterium bohemicum]